jgi:O-antigen/teichoic acid export membrane protein
MAEIHKINMKEHMKLSFIYTATAAFSPVIQVLIQPLYEGSGRLNAIDFSQLAITELFTSLIFVFTLYGMGNAIARFYYDVEENTPEYKKLMSGIFSGILLRGAVVLILVILFQNYIGKLFHQQELQDFSRYGYMCLITGIGRAVNVTAAALFRNEKKVISFILVSMGLGVFRTAFQLIGLFYFDMSFIGYMYGSAVGTGIVTLLILVFIFRKSGISYDRKLMKPVNQFALPLAQYSIIVWVLTYADKFMLERFPVDLGIYNTAVTFGAGIAIVLQGLQGANQPEVFRVMKAGINERQQEIRQLSNALLMQSMVIIIGAILPTMLYLKILYETDVRLAANIISLVFIRNILRTQFIIFSYPSYFLKKTRIFLYLNSAGMIVNLVLNYLLIPKFFFYGAIASGLISDLIMVVGIYYYQKKIVVIDWNKKKLLYFPLGVVGFAIVVDAFRVYFDLNPLLSTSILIIFSFTAMAALYRLEIQKILKKVWK